MRFEFDYWLTIDGGALFSTTANSAGYGSYHLKARTVEKHTMRLDFGCGMTRQRVCDPAEYRTLLAGSNDLVGHIQRAGKLLSAYSLLVHNDSQLVVGQSTPAAICPLKGSERRPCGQEPSVRGP